MTLNHVLSAVRELILDQETTSDTFDHRRTEFAKRFPQLEQKEIDDLAAIAPERMQVYTELIYNGELSMLRWVYPITFAVLTRLKQLEGEPSLERQYFFGIVRELHRFRAWRSDSSRLLAGNFQDFMIESKPDLQQAWPGLLDIIDYEKTAVDVFYAPDVPHREMTLSQLEAFSVGELLDLPVFMPGFVALRKFQYDVLPLGVQWRDEGKIPGHLPGRSDNQAVCGRDVETLMPRWLAVDKAAHHALRQLSSAESLTLNDVAGVYLEAQTWPEDQTEEIQFQRFFQALVEWISAGVICVKHGLVSC